MFKLLIFQLFLVSLMYGQSISIYSGGTLPLNMFNSKEKDSFVNIWYPSLNVGLGYEDNLSNKFMIRGYGEINSFFFKDYNLYSSIPEMHFVESKSNNSNIFRLGLNINYILSRSNIVKSYIFTGITYNIERVSNIRLKWYLEDYGYIENELVLPKKNYISQVFGVGFPIINFDSSNIFAEIRYLTNYGDRFHLSLNFGAKLDI